MWEYIDSIVGIGPTGGNYQSILQNYIVALTPTEHFDSPESSNNHIQKSRIL